MMVAILLVTRKSTVISSQVNVLLNKAGSYTTHWRARRSVIEQTHIPAIVRKRTAVIRPEEPAAKLADNHLFRSTDDGLEHYTVYKSAVEYRGQRTPVAMTQPRGVEGIGYLIIHAIRDNQT